jgi:AcrR family transcriptional regulator
MAQQDDGASEHPTRTLIVSVASDLLKQHGPEGFRIDEVLERTSLTRGAIYHHFDNVDDLIESALLAIFSEGVEATVRFIRDVLGSASTFEQFRAGVFQANQNYVRNPELRQVRRLRAYAMANTVDRMAGPLAAEQQRLTDDYVTVIVAAQDKGWVRRNIDPVALAVFVQAYSFGVIVDDISQTHLDPNQWSKHIEDYFDALVFEPNPGT